MAEATPPALKEVTIGKVSPTEAGISYSLTRRGKGKLVVSETIPLSTGDHITIDSASGGTSFDELVTGLKPGTQYFFRVVSWDIRDTAKKSGSKILDFQTAQLSTNPILSSSNISEVSSSSVRVNMNLTESGRAVLKYGTEGNINDLQNFSYGESEIAKSHQHVLNDLAPDTKYYYVVVSFDPEEKKRNFSEVMTFSTGKEASLSPAAGPQLSNSSVSEISSSSVRVNMNLTDSGRAILRYGTKDEIGDLRSFSYGQSEVIKSHQHILENLTPNTKYYYAVVSFDPVKKERSYSEVMTFSTGSGNTGSSNASSGGDSGSAEDSSPSASIATTVPVASNPEPEALPIGTTRGNCISFGDIAKDAPTEYCLSTEDEYLGEYLRQRPNVSWWYIDKTNNCIQDIQEPACTKTVKISPTGGADNTILTNAMNEAGSGGCVDGQGKTFTLKAFKATKQGVTFKNMKLEPFGGMSVLVDVTAKDVSFIRTPVDLLNKAVNDTFRVRATSHGFHLVEGGVKNLRGRATSTGTSGHAFVRLSAGVGDYYIVNNEFKDAAVTTVDDKYNSTLRGIHYNGTIGRIYKPTSGVIASNLFQNFQAKRNPSNDADSVVFQGWEIKGDTLDEKIRFTFREPVKFLANVGIDGGKRLLKLQSGSVVAHGNFNHYKTSDGPLGKRKTSNMFALHNVSKNSITNNMLIADEITAGGWTTFTIEFSHYFYKPEHRNKNNKISCNIMEFNSRDTSAGGYLYRVIDFCDDGVTSWPDSKLTNNHVRGTGIMDTIYWFSQGEDEYGTKFDHSGNKISMETELGTYRIGYPSQPESRQGQHCPLVKGR